jgi:nitrogen fixation protein FixH
MTPKTKWTIAIVGLLSGNVLAMVTLAATSARGGSQVIPAYYEKATHYDDTLDHDAASNALGWQATATLVGGRISVDLRDRDGGIVRGARVTATGYQRAHASDTFTVELAEADGYRGTAAVRAGVNDVVVIAVRDGARYEQRMVIEAR